jgi:hypothetical protein
MRPARVFAQARRGDTRGSLRPCMRGRGLSAYAQAVGLLVRRQAACRMMHLGIIVRPGEVSAPA